MPKSHVLEPQIPSLAKRGYYLSEYEPEISFHNFPPWLHTVKKSSYFNTDEYLVGTRIRTSVGSADRSTVCFPLTVRAPLHSLSTSLPTACRPRKIRIGKSLHFGTIVKRRFQPGEKRRRNLVLKSKFPFQ